MTDATKYPLATRYGYTVSMRERDDRYSYTRPDGDCDDEGFATEAEAWSAAESDARLWDDDHGAGFDALETLEAMRAILGEVNGNSEPWAMADALERLSALASGKPDPGRCAPTSEERRDLAECGYDVQGPDAEGRFWSFNPEGDDFSPNAGHATEADAWAACRHDREA